jgi:hypothetical protein
LAEEREAATEAIKNMPLVVPLNKFLARVA